MYFLPISAVKVLNTTNQLNSNKTCRFDGVKTKFVKIAGEIIALLLTNIYYHRFALGVFPSCTKTAKVIPVVKSGEIKN